MKLKATCPDNPEHKTFISSATVRQVWVVDETGDFIEEVDASFSVTKYPSTDDVWTCQTCGAEAMVTAS